MLPRKNVLDFNPLSTIPWAFEFYAQEIGQVSRLRLRNLFFRRYPFFKNLIVLRKTVEIGLDLRLGMKLKKRLPPPK